MKAGPGQGTLARWTCTCIDQHGSNPHLHAVDALVPPQGEPDLSAIDASISRK